MPFENWSKIQFSPKLFGLGMKRNVRFTVNFTHQVQRSIQSFYNSFLHKVDFPQRINVVVRSYKSKISEAVKRHISAVSKISPAQTTTSVYQNLQKSQSPQHTVKMATDTLSIVVEFTYASYLSPKTL